MPETVTNNLSTVVPVEIVEQVEQIAEQQRWSVSFTVRALLEEALSARARKAAKKQ